MSRIVLPVLALLCALSPLLLLSSHWVPIEHITTFLGRFHPVVLHLPIGILLLTAFLEYLHLFSFGRFSFPTRVPVFLGAFTAVLAMALGILLMQGEAMQGELLLSHLRWGIATAVGSIIVLLVRLWPNFSESRITRTLYRLSILLTCVILGWASHRGASITHGENYLTDYQPWKTTEPIDTATSVRIAAMQGPLEERNTYEHLIVPILEDKCYACHQSKSFKGNLLMDDYDSMLAGGSSGPSFIPFQAEESRLIQRIHLPIGDEEHMPPANKPQLSEAEIELLQWWIQSGAPIDQMFAGMDLSEAFSTQVEVVTATLLEQYRRIDSIEDPVIDLLSPEAIADARAPQAHAVSELKKRYPGRINYINQQSKLLSVRNYQDTWTDDDLQTLYSVAESIVELVIPGARLTADSHRSINAMTQLKKLDLRDTTLGNDFLAGVQLPQLERLNLFQAGLTDETLKPLSSMNGLKRLTLGGNNLSADSLQSLQEQLPSCIITGDLRFSKLD